ncbi:DNAJ protein JJJ1 homolog [Oryza glaberrima]|uniref:DNAJ protein JJJ1 homolog n=1 Tax=Oryza glaberrima TaxID=4538 RepID=UPI00224C3148|nr:DNAJ protein JJJ1 homolog [Oryza glaberrima]
MASAAAPKRCYYEVLGVPRDCSPADIKLAFRRLALSLHPDKQPPGSDVAAATAAFQELQHAHSVLSDPHERSYYDSHRSQILFSDHHPSSGPGRGGGVASASASPVPDLFAFFSSSAFSGFSDSGRGFYKVYGDVFDRVFAQELAYARRMGMPADAVPTPPVIGNLDSPHAQVAAFYSYWLGFSTAMDFGWAAEWDAARGESRRVRRLMEEDNKKATRKARREYNDAVRGLAAFCKKRDKRVVDMALKKKGEEEKRKAEEAARKKEEERRRKEQAMAYQEPEWARVDEDEAVVFEDDEEEETRAKRKEELYCVACNKKFKSDKQWKNHEQSKKHRDKVSELRMVFEEEEEALKDAEEEEPEEVDVGFDFQPAQESEESEFSDAAEELADELSEGLEVRDEEEKGDKHLGNGEQKVGSYDETSVLEEMLSRSRRKNRKSGFVAPQEEASPAGAMDDDDDEDTSYEINNVKKKGRRRRAAKKGGTYADNGQGRKSENQPEESRHNNDENGADDKMEDPSSNEDSAAASKEDQQKGKTGNTKKNKKGTEKNTTISSEQKGSSKGKKQKEVSKAPSNDCETCGSTFDSRNKLFSHLEETGHAMLKTRQKNR